MLITLNESNWKELSASYVGTAPEGYWQTEFTPAKDAALGSYEIKVRVINSNNSISNWMYSNLEVLNNLPVIKDMPDFYADDSQFLWQY